MKIHSKEVNMSDLTWTMNCILFGAKIIDLVRAGKDQEALQEIKELTQFDDTTAAYLLVRLKEVA